jgi:mono/diheme cytochrome c family protein
MSPVVKPGTLCRGAVVVLAALLAGAAPAAAQGRGELLYNTHCIACHSSQLHWRDNKQVADWSSLRAQVRRWQAAASLAWTDDDIEQVAQYLNGAFYHLPRAGRPQAAAPVAPTQLAAR